MSGKKLSVAGECKQCGDCCRFDVNWAYFQTPGDLSKRLEALEAKGYRIKQIGTSCIQAEYDHRCPQLTQDNKCVLHDQGKKPEQCAVYPLELLEAADIGLDLNKALPEGCGFKIVEE